MYDEFAPFIDGSLIELQSNLYIPLYDWYKPSATTQGIVPYVINIYIYIIYQCSDTIYTRYKYIYHIYIICTIYIYTIVWMVQAQQIAVSISIFFVKASLFGPRIYGMGS